MLLINYSSNIVNSYFQKCLKSKWDISVVGGAVSLDLRAVIMSGFPP